MSAYGIVIPVYNAGEHLPALLAQVAIQQRHLPQRLFVLIVDDGSQPPLPPLRQAHLNILQLRHRVNRGKGAALRSGFEYMLKNREIVAVITMDADLQHLPKNLGDFIKAYEAREGDIIVGQRQRKPGLMPLHRIVSNALTTWIISAMIGQNAYDSQCGFRLYGRRALETVQVQEERFHMESEFLIRGGWANLRIGAVPVPTVYNGSPSAIRNLPDTLNFIRLIFKLLLERVRSHV